MRTSCKLMKTEESASRWRSSASTLALHKEAQVHFMVIYNEELVTVNGGRHFLGTLRMGAPHYITPL